jgi:hypothetical protein
MKKQNLFHVQDTVFNPGKPDAFIDISASKHRGSTEGEDQSALRAEESRMIRGS